MKNRKIFMCGAFAFLAASLAGGTIAFGANAESETKAINEIGINMEQGASMRIATAGENNAAATTGLRFTMKVSKSDYNAVDPAQYDGIEWGVLIAPVESVKAADFTAENLFGENAKYVFNRELTSEDTGKYAAINVTETELTLASETNLKIENAENTYVFSGYMHTIKEENLTRGFVGRGYVKYTVKGETTPQYKFAEYFDGDVENNTRSAYYVAAKYVADGTVTNAEAKAYVQANYLENETALATANVNITVNDYDEDITIGTYKTEVSATNTVTAKIGETYDLSAEENAKEGYTLRKDLSSAAEPVYRGQVLLMKRYYESNDYIPFSNTAGAVTKATADDGEEVAGAYKYTTSVKGDQGLLLASFIGAQNDKILRNASSKTGTYLCGYVTMSIRWQKVGAGGFNLVSLLGDYNNDYNTNWCVSSNWFSGNGTALGGINFYKESGYKAKNLTAGTWYKAAFPIYTNYHNEARFGRMYLQIDAQKGSGSSVEYVEQTVYFKDVTISAEDIYASQIPETPDPEAWRPFISSTSKATLGLVTEEGEFKYSYKFSYERTDSVTAQNLYFATTTNEWAPKPTDTTIITANAKFITMEVYFNNVNTINVISRLGSYKIDNFCVSTYWLRFGETNNTTGVIFYDNETGEVVSQPQNNTWYKIAMQVDRNDANWNGLDMYMEVSAPAVGVANVYFKNVAYGSTNIYAK